MSDECDLWIQRMAFWAVQEIDTAIVRAVIDHDHLDGNGGAMPKDALCPDAIEQVTQGISFVVDRHDDADARAGAR